MLKLNLTFVVWGSCVTEKIVLLKVEEKMTLRTLSGRERNIHR